MNKKRWILVICILIILAILAGVFNCLNATNQLKLKSVKNAKDLERIYKGNTSAAKEIIVGALTMPFSFFVNGVSRYANGFESIDAVTNTMGATSSGLEVDGIDTNIKGESSSSKDYSTTNIQVENVDEADITKTDGDYIYSISGSNVIITDVRQPEKIKKAATITLTDTGIPEDMILYQDKLAVIGNSNTGSSYYYSRYGNTTVNIYDISDRESPTLVKKYTLFTPYYTSRCIGSKLYVIASGTLKKENDEVIAYYSEDNIQKDIGYENIKYLDKLKSRNQTIISMLDLENSQNDITIHSYLMDATNAYISENNIYLLEQRYNNKTAPSVLSLFGFWGAIGPFKYEEKDRKSGYDTDIYKFNILEDGSIKYDCYGKVKGKTINQYSIDEYKETLRIAVYDDEGSRVVVLDKKLNQIGATRYLAKGERMYSSRFIGEKAYLVTYKTVDPLYVIDLKDGTNPTVLGELKIPGYSTYLHPYDENHLIGIGMETQEIVNRNSSGKIISTTARTVGMKMALFDVSDVHHPVQISSTLIGDRRTTSAILTNPKALLFSKQKELIAIPVNNFAEDFSVRSTENYTSAISSYTNYSKPRISEGYLIYKINTKEGFSLKGTITHELGDASGYSYRTTAKLLRGMYIDDNLFTVSEGAVKVNNLNTLKLISELKLK